MINRIKKLGVLLGAVAIGLSVAACGEKLIKPEDKQIEAMIEYTMPDFDATRENAQKKVEKWLVSAEKEDNSTAIYLNTADDKVNGRGSVTFQTRSKDLTVGFDIEITITKPNLIKFRAHNFEDQEGPRKGDSDRAYVFHNMVKDRVLDLADELESYMGSDSRVADILNQQ